MIAILFTLFEKPNNYVFGDDLLFRSPGGKDCMLQTLTCVYIKQWLLGIVQTFSGGLFWFGWEELREGDYVGGFSHGGTSHGEEIFNEGGEGFSSII